MRRFVIRYGLMANVGYFRSLLEDINVADPVIVRSNRGQEVGQVLQELPEDHQAGPTGEVLRRLSFEDRRRLKRIKKEDIPQELEFCRQRIKEQGLEMKLVDVEHLFDGSKIIFYFLANGRVDFRNLVRELAKQYQTRIELKQIGVRDEARLVGEWGHCGRPLCCKTFMKNLEPITMKMAKNQKATLDPAKISGLCGRLMCCLRYEDDIYEKLKAKLPKKGTLVNSRQGQGKVIDYNIIKQQVRIETEKGRFLTVSIQDILSTGAANHQPGHKQ